MWPSRKHECPSIGPEKKDRSGGPLKASREPRSLPYVPQ
jgi:hypothetical protein